jgi:hypothetical protein
MKKEYHNKYHRINTRINKLEQDIKAKLDNVDNNERGREEIAHLKSKLSHLLKKVAKDQKEET